VIFGAAFFALVMLLVTVLRVVFLVIGPRGSTTAAEIVAELVFRTGLLGAALGAGYVCARFLEGLPWRSLGLTFHFRWARDLLLGFAIGFASLVVAVAIASRGLSFSFNDKGWSYLIPSMLGSALLLFAAALAEEAMFRGYALQTLTRAKLAWLGVLLTSVPFGLVHLSNPNVVPGLWLPLGVHWAWNWALGWFFGLPISGIHLVSEPLLKAQDSGPKWLTGGSYGIEGGVACTISLIIFTVFVWRTRWVSATPELMQMTSEENPATLEPVLSIRPAEDQA
jgi:membrane protease YdiL (CAAX protease family)